MILILKGDWQDVKEKLRQLKAEFPEWEPANTNRKKQKFFLKKTGKSKDN